MGRETYPSVLPGYAITDEAARDAALAVRAWYERGGESGRVSTEQIVTVVRWALERTRRNDRYARDLLQAQPDFSFSAHFQEKQNQPQKVIRLTENAGEGLRFFVDEVEYVPAAKRTPVAFGLFRPDGTLDYECVGDRETCAYLARCSTEEQHGWRTGALYEGPMPEPGPLG